MSRQTQDNGSFDAVELIAEQGMDGLPEAITLLINQAMKMERTQFLKAEAYERTEARRGYANGYKPRTLRTRAGELELQVPQTRGGGFYPSSLERGMRSERALKLALAEMYVQGVSTRKVAAITRELCGFDVTSAEVSRCAELLDEELTKWRNRPLAAFPYIFMDATYMKIRYDGQVIDMGVLIAMGVGTDGKRQILGVSAELSEAEVHWRSFLTQLKDRGLYGVKLIISDAHTGMQAARKAVFPAVPWQRCQFHLQQNATQYVPKVSQRKEVAKDIRAIFNAPDQAEAKRLLERFLDKWQAKAPRLAQWAETAIPQSFAVFAMPEAHWRRLRTSNVMERFNKEVKRRTKVATLFPNPASCERLVTAIAMEKSEEWVTGKIYLNMNLED